MTSAPDASNEDVYLLLDAESAQGSVGALVEILSGCQPGQQVTAVFMRSLLLDVKMHLDNVVDGLRHPTEQTIMDAGSSPA